MSKHPSETGGRLQGEAALKGTGTWFTMLGKCANRLCSSPRTADQGKLFRLDIDIANTAGENRRETAYVWLCARCALQMRPSVEVAGSTVQVRLGAISRSARNDEVPALPLVN